MAFRQATVIEPEVASTWKNLTALYRNLGRTDLALECVERYIPLVEADLEAMGDEGIDQIEALETARQQWVGCESCRGNAT